MTPDQRRETIVRAALPLVAELGAAVTTAKIARAAGIGEATIFRVFDDKNAVLEACVAAALDPTQVHQELQSIPLDQPLAARLAEAIYALDAYLNRMGTVIRAMHGTLGTGRRGPGPLPGARDESQAITRQAVLDLFEPDQERLRLPAATLADAFLNLFFGQVRRSTPAESTISVEELVDLFLFGALTRADHQD
ncbi:TetR/AcrR family transcriptional regulator [Actinoplanes couchii]|uniref:TetR family transcriptional regulator n=2 Tax=Actinoplanes couchii TaxID=403638 RepID=A0ABQ3XMZ8_9ACTN|nr:TetR family transcriptional regulator [Actinoplanes couchii]